MNNPFKMNAPLLATLAILASLASIASAADRPPNIVFILADDVGQEVLGCYGGETYRTPHLDALAESGIRFRHCYSMPVCHPSRICLLTGKYPFQLNNPAWGSFPVSEEKTTLAHVLRGKGYATAISGKWQIALLGKDPRHPNRLGFDEHCLFGWHEGPRYFEPMIWQNGKLRDDTAGTYGPDIYVDYLADFFRRNKERPFFAFYSMALCHDVTDDLEKPVPHGPNDRYESYAEMVASMDTHVGQIVRSLDELSLRDNTLIFFSTDNGTPKSYIARADGDNLVRLPVVSRQSGKDVPGGKGDLTDLGTRVPTIASWPGTVPSGRVSDALMDFSDLLPTFAELAGANPSHPALPGQSFTAALRHPRDPGRDWVFAERGKQYWFRSQRWKLYSDGRFFDMQADPGETSPLPMEGLSRQMAEQKQRLADAAQAIITDR